MTPVPPGEIARVTDTAIAMVTKRFKGQRLPVAVDLDDLQQAARLGVYVASTRFDPSHGVTFMTFGVRYGVGYALCAIGDGMRVGRGMFSRQREFAEANEFLSLDHSPREELALRDMQADPRAAEAFATFEVIEVLRLLSPSERDILAPIILDGCTAAEMARHWRISRTTAGNRIRRASARLQRELA